VVSSHCSQITSLIDPKCVMAPLDNQLEPTPFAHRVDQLEHAIHETTGTKVTLAMFKTWVAFDFFLKESGFPFCWWRARCWQPGLLPMPSVRA
jgi:hypothetical protein